ncbi:MAG: hypothetical protein Q7S84_01995 [bacterium]|nr:hypothetical protein [bacterium]
MDYHKFFWGMLVLLVFFMGKYFFTLKERENLRNERDSARARFTVLAEGLRLASNSTPETGVELPPANDSTFRVLLLRDCPGSMTDRTYLEVTTVRLKNGSFEGQFWTGSGYRQIVVRKDDVERYF